MKYLFYLLIIVTFWSCSTTKNIPEDKYLLNDFEIKSSNKDINAADWYSFVRQKPNSSIPLLGKVRLRMYNAAGQDTSKWLTRTIQKLGQPPVIFSDRQAQISATQIAKELSNEGYLNAEVDTIINKKGKKISVTYNINSGTPYTIRNYEIAIEDTTISRLFTRMKRFSNIKSGMPFDKWYLEEERTLMNNILHNRGYYSFSKDNLYYKADTTLNSHQVDLYLSLHPNPDSTHYKRYKLNNITIISGFDPTNNNNRNNFQQVDTTYHQGIAIVHGRNNFLRKSMLLRNNYLKKGNLYSEVMTTRTYSAFSSVGAIKQVNIDYFPVKSDSLNLLDAKITLSPANSHWFQAGLDGTNSEGDIGIAPSISYRHQNIFNGAEVLSIKLKGAYEFVTGDKNTELLDEDYYEFGIETSLSFPQFLFPWIKKSWREIPSASTQVSIGLTNQHRAEYKRQFFNTAYTFRWSTLRGSLNHAFDFFDINYAKMPWVSSKFKDFFKNNKILEATYQDQLIARSGYNITYTQSDRRRRFPKNSFTIRAGLDLAGWLPHTISRIGNPAKNSNGQYEIAGIAYAEYVKTTFSFSHTRNFDNYQSFAYNIAVGFANPYGNSQILPYEKRFFSGGANSVRGWSTRRLGPGSYQTTDSTTFINQVGDLKLDLSIEYRNKISEFIELAGFIDAGNVWTIKKYAGQESGQFTFKDFYKEIALAYGLGIRFDLDFLLLRFDTGMKAYDPSLEQSKRLIINKPRLRNMAWHFAIGYPF